MVGTIVAKLKRWIRTGTKKVYLKEGLKIYLGNGEEGNNHVLVTFYAALKNTVKFKNKHLLFFFCKNILYNMLFVIIVVMNY